MSQVESFLGYLDSICTGPLVGYLKKAIRRNKTNDADERDALLF
jgi:hypothetical protein